MIPEAFDYVRVESLAEASDVLSRRPGSRILAGGQSLIPLLKRRLISVGTLVDISRVRGLDGIDVRGDTVSIGALATHRDVELNADLACEAPLLRETANVVADPPVRNRGTLCGSICFGDPAGDWPAVALTLEATLHALTPSGERSISALDLYRGPMETSLGSSEVVGQITFPLLGDGWGTAYRKFRHPSSGYALVGVAALVRAGADGRCAECRVGITGAGRIAARARQVERSLTNGPLTPGAVREAAQLAAEDLELGSDIYADAAYRTQLVRVEVRRALETATARATESAGERAGRT